VGGRIDVENLAIKRWKTGIPLAQFRQWVKVNNLSVGVAELSQHPGERLSVSQGISLLDPATLACRHDETALEIIFATSLRDAIHQHECRIPGRHVDRKLLELIPPAPPQVRIRMHSSGEDHNIVPIETIYPIAVLLAPFPELSGWASDRGVKGMGHGIGEIAHV